MNWRLTGFSIAAMIVIVDQLTKWWVVTGFLRLSDAPFMAWLAQKAPQHDFVRHEITSFLNIVMVWNPGVSFGLLQTEHGYAAYGLTIMALVIAFGFALWLWREADKWRAIAIGLIIGGALGNVWDRLRFGAVVDFVDLHVAGYHWPAFNVADSAICIGVIVLLIDTFLHAPKSGLTEKKI